jgi:hypothetical protein
MYSLARKVGVVMTCSCGYPSALDPMNVVPKEFCFMLPADDPNALYYTLNCVGDLDEGTGVGVKLTTVGFISLIHGKLNTWKRRRGAFSEITFLFIF